MAFVVQVNINKHICYNLNLLGKTNWYQNKCVQIIEKV